MNLKVGIVGMPNVGKSTLFNALLKKQAALAANYPFATIEPNVGVVEVPDPRLVPLAKVVNTQKIVPAIVEFYDIAGLVKGASQGEGLGNQFLSHIREVSAIAHIVRLFEDKDIVHVANRVNPAEDMTIIEEELQLADLQTLEKQREPKGAASKEEVAAWEVVKKVKDKLNQGVSVRNQRLTDEEKELIGHLNFLTEKPVIYCFNCSLEQLENREETIKRVNVILASEARPGSVDSGQARMTVSFILFNPLYEETLDEMIKEAYKALGLISFLTAGEKEVRAWTIKKDTQAVDAAGEIHTDFIKKFVKADIVTYEDFIKTNGWAGARETGKVHTVGRDHVIQDGDVVEFKISA